MSPQTPAEPGPDGRPRCRWASGPWLRPYHDLEWGVPVRDDHLHLELLVLEGAQSGLSWLTILKRREAYRRAFAEFQPEALAAFAPARVERLLGDPSIIRHRGKIEAAVANARALLRVRDEWGSFDAYIWSFLDGRPLRGSWDREELVPARTELSAHVSGELRRRGFQFVGPTTCYSYLQAAGLVMDHVRSCYRYRDLSGGGPGGTPPRHR